MDLEEISDVTFFSSKASEFNNRSITEFHSDSENALETEMDLEGSTIDKNFIHSRVSWVDSNRLSANLVDYNELKYHSSEKVVENIVYSGSSGSSSFSDDQTQTLWNYGEEEDKWSFLMNELNVVTPETLTDAESDALICDFVKVKFRTDTNETMVSAFNVTSTIKDMKDRVAKLFKVNPDQFWLTFRSQVCDESAQLIEFGDEDLEPVEFEIQSKQPNIIAAPGEFSRYVPFITKQTVKIQESTCDKHVSVLIEDQSFVKSWLGGYRNRTTKVEYHHASVQTLPRSRPPDSLPQLSRETQTPVFPLKETLNDTPVSKSTQMCRTDHYIPTVFDKVLESDPDRFNRTPRYAFRTVALLLIKVNAWVRRSAENKKIMLEKERQKECLEIDQKGKAMREEETLASIKNLLIGCVYPITRNDFYALYLLTGMWCRAQQAKIIGTKTSEARKAAYLELLNKEIDLLSVIDRKRIEAKKEVLMKQNMFFVDTCARPVIFCNNMGRMSSLDTLATQQAREYQEILASYLNMSLTNDERMDVLCTLKALIQSTFYSPELVELLERELSLMLIGLTDKELKGLRERIKQLLIFHLHNTEVNPACKGFKKPSHPRTDNKLYLCLYCHKLKTASEYNVHVKMTSFTQCFSCSWLMNISVERVNLDPFSKILAHVRKSEMEQCCYSSVCYVLQPIGMMYLVSRIWNKESIISRHKELRNLRMVRFRRNEDWTPWNCILLTLEETVIHLNIRNLTEFYSQPLLDRIYWRHLKAKQHFMPLLLNDRFMQETKLWFNVQDTGKFLLPSHVNRFAQHEDFEYIA